MTKRSIGTCLLAVLALFFRLEAVSGQSGTCGPPPALLSAPTGYATGPDPSASTLADFNKDGRLDVVTAGVA